MFGIILLLVLTIVSQTSADTVESAPIWITARHYVPSKFDTDCDLKVLTAGSSWSPPSRGGPPSRRNWNGNVMFLADDLEMLMIGLHPKRGKLAVRNDVFRRGTRMPMWDYRWVGATYPEADDEGKREYTFEFTPTGFVLKCADMILITIPYEELTDDKEEFLSSITSVEFELKLSPNKGPISLQYARICQEEGAPPDPDPVPPLEDGCAGARCVVHANGDDAILAPGESITADNGEITLLMQTDGNLVIYCPGGVPVWHSNTWVWYTNDRRLVIKNTGEMFVVDTSDRKKWSSYTDGNPNGVTLVAQDDNNLVLYTKGDVPGGVPIWHTNTAHSC